LILSALGEVDERVKGLRAGGDDYLAKPYAFSELLARIENLGRRAAQEPQQTRLKAADLEMDLLARTVTRAGQPILLQPRGFKLLRTSTFRLSALYLLLFALSVGAILAFVYWNTAVLLERQTDETIKAEIQGIAEQYRYRGLAGVADTVRRRSTVDSSSIYLLFTPEGKPVTGNLNAIPVQ